VCSIDGQRVSCGGADTKTTFVVQGSSISSRDLHHLVSRAGGAGGVGYDELRGHVIEAVRFVWLLLLL